MPVEFKKSPVKKIIITKSRTLSSVSVNLKIIAILLSLLILKLLN